MLSLREQVRNPICVNYSVAIVHSHPVESKKRKKINLFEIMVSRKLILSLLLFNYYLIKIVK